MLPAMPAEAPAAMTSMDSFDVDAVMATADASMSPATSINETNLSNNVEPTSGAPATEVAAAAEAHLLHDGAHARRDSGWAAAGRSDFVQRADGTLFSLAFSFSFACGWTLHAGCFDVAPPKPERANAQYTLRTHSAYPCTLLLLALPQLAVDRRGSHQRAGGIARRQQPAPRSI